MNSSFGYPTKNKKEIWPILAAVFLVISLVLSVLYFLEIRLNKQLQSESVATTTQTSSVDSETEEKIQTDTTAETTAQSDLEKLTAQIKTLTQEKTAAETAKTTAEAAKTAAEAAKTAAENNLSLERTNEAIAVKYNDLLAYFIDVVDTHDGLAGITQAEYNSAKTLAEKTGDATLVDKLDYVWDQAAVAQIDRIILLLDYIQTKIDSKLK